MPKKALVRSIDVWNTVQRAKEFGVHVTDAKLDWQKMIERESRIIGKFVDGKGPYLKKLGVDLVMGTASFISPTSIRVGDVEYTADKFLIGTGSKVNLLPIKGVEYVTTSKELFELKKLPSSLAIIGGGVISLEFAHIFASAGVEVSILQRGMVLLNSQDEESSTIIQEISEKRGIKVLTNTTANGIEKDDDQLVVEYNQEGKIDKLKIDMVLMATGRVPDLDDLGLENAGVEFSDKGIKVNKSLQTSVDHIYAAGDSIGGLMLTPVAAYEAKVAMRNAYREIKQELIYSDIPVAIFTLPPVASVGLTEKQAAEKGIDVQVNKLPFSHSGTAIILGEEEGYAKILTDKRSGKIIGAHMVGLHVDEIIHEIAIAMKGNLSLQDLAEVIQIHPTISEAIIELAMQGARELKENENTVTNK
jgi:pyruvate/2-oxoglutarate dehydrogenase complex dihydrolipoamide dehydrogenase (E3) component